MQTLLCLFCALFLILGDIHGDELPKGVPISRSSFYKVGQSFTCLDGSSAISWWQVNDDYCDCRDGSDEPGTSACLNGRFFCRDMQYRPVYLPSAYVNDSICDCCDGGDEYGSSTNCPSTCGSLAASLREAQSIKRNQIEKGHKIFQEYVQNLKERKAKGLFNEEKQYDETMKLAEYDVNSVSRSIQTNEENVDSHLSVGEEKQTLNEPPSSSSMDSNQQSFTHDNDNTLNEHEESSLSDMASHEEKTNEYDRNNVDNEDNHMKYDESNGGVTDKQLDDELHHEIPETPSLDEKPVIKDIPTPIPIDYGPEEGFRMLTELPDGCLELNDREYTYSLCPFKSVHQKSIGSSNSDPGTCIGRWGRWLESDEYEKSYKVMYYENGQQCWNGPTRTTKVFVHCGDSNHLTSVSEPSRCEYVMQLITPAACSEDPDELFRKLHPEL
ncbi:unnamed protein product [Schistosoma rodhaini]|uniref:Glucosidase 2 subunit beta n=1 Tax=Schistosoma rodhaini TaxID=6188 RepID=A0AA85GED6_9TREM|nr:unnamed protein product [Schistosoma rodhaini]